MCRVHTNVADGTPSLTTSADEKRKKAGCLAHIVDLLLKPMPVAKRGIKSFYVATSRRRGEQCRKQLPQQPTATRRDANADVCRATVRSSKPPACLGVSRCIRATHAPASPRLLTRQGNDAAASSPSRKCVFKRQRFGAIGVMRLYGECIIDNKPRPDFADPVAVWIGVEADG